MSISEEHLTQLAALELFAERDQTAAKVLAQYALAHRSETPGDLALLSAEHENLEQAIFWCQEQTAERASLLIALALSQMHYWRIQGYWRLGQGAIRQAAEAAHLLGDKRSETSLLGNLALILSSFGDMLAARGVCQEILPFLENPYDQAGILHELGNIASAQGLWVEARDQYTKALVIREQLADAIGIDHTLQGMANVAVNQGHYQEAGQLLIRALSLAEQIKDVAGQAAVYHEMARIYVRQGDYESAREYYNKSLIGHQELGDRAGIAANLHGLGSIAIEAGLWVKAKKLLSQAMDLRLELGDLPGQAATHAQLGLLYLQQGYLTLAEEEYMHSQKIYQPLGFASPFAAVIHALGAIALSRGNLPEAQSRLEEALGIRQRIGDRFGEAATLEALGTLHRRIGASNQAQYYWRAAIDLQRELGDLSGLGATLHQLGFLATQHKNFVLARSYLEECMKVKSRVDNPESLALTQALLAQVLIHDGDIDVGGDMLKESLRTLRSLGSPWSDKVQKTVDTLIR